MAELPNEEGEHRDQREEGVSRKLKIESSGVEELKGAKVPEFEAAGHENWPEECHDPSTARPDAAHCRAGEKAAPLRGKQGRRDGLPVGR